MRGTICNALPWLALVLTLLGMRDWDPVIPVSLLAVVALAWVINWLVHHISLPWARYLRILFWVFVVGAIIVIPELRASFEEALRGLLSLQSSTLIVFSLVTLIAWAVICLARPTTQSNSQ